MGQAGAGTWGFHIECKLSKDRSMVPDLTWKSLKVAVILYISNSYANKANIRHLIIKAILNEFNTFGRQKSLQTGHLCSTFS